MAHTIVPGNNLNFPQSEQSQFAEVLAQATLALNESLDLDTVLDRIFVQIRRVIPFTSATISLFTEDTWHRVRVWGFENQSQVQALYQQSYPIKDFPIFMEITRTLKPVLIEDTKLEPDWVFIPDMEWIRSSVIAPLILEGKVTGVVNMLGDKPGAFTQEMADRVMAFVAPAAIAVQHAQLYATEQRARMIAEILSTASLALTQSLDINVVLDKILEYTQNLVPFDVGGVALVENENRVVVRAVYGSKTNPAPTELLHRSHDSKERPYLQEVLNTRKTVLIPDTQEFPGWKPFFGVKGMKWLGIPLFYDQNTIGILMLVKTRKHYFTQEHIQLAEALVSNISIAIQNAWLFEQVRTSNERLQFLSHRLVEIQENERRYVAQELHDEVGQALASLYLALKNLEKNAENPEEVRIGTSGMSKVLDSVMDDLHQLAMDLRPASLDQLGLETALNQHIHITCEKFGLNIQFEMVGVKERLPANMEIALYRIVQEALSNIIRHASASHVDVLIQPRGGSLILIVEDDGVGFDPMEAAKSDRLGLFGMRERAEMLGGKLVIESAVGHGTTIQVEVPYEYSNSDRG